MRLGLTAAALAVLACAVIALARHERRSALGPQRPGEREPSVALSARRDLEPAVRKDGLSAPGPLVPPAGLAAVSKPARGEVKRTAVAPRPCRLEITVSCGGLPAADLAIALETCVGATCTERALGRADARGMLAADVEPASSARVVLRSDLRAAELARSAELQLLPASVQEVELEVAARRLVLVVPELAFDHRFPTQYRMIPLHEPSAPAVRDFFDRGVWRAEPGGSRADLGWVEPGVYAFRVQIEAHVLEVTAEVEAGQGDARFALQEAGG